MLHVGLHVGHVTNSVGTSIAILYKPLFSRTVISAFLDFCGNSRVG